MAAETITLAEMSKDVLMAITNAESSDSVTSRHVYLAIHAACREFVAKTEPLGFQADADITTAAGTHTYALADDVMRLIDPGFYFTASDYRTLTRATEQEARSQEWDRTQQSGDPRYYVLRTKSSTTGLIQVKFYPTPSSIRTIRYHYIALPVRLWPNVATSTNIDIRMAAEFHPALVWGAVTHLPRYLNGVADLAWYKEMWEKALEDGRAAATPIAGQAYQRAPYRSGLGSDRGFMWQDPTIVAG